MAKTFADLGIPFPLFLGHVDDSREYTGVGRCSLCGAVGSHCFHLATSGELVLPCGKCLRPAALSASERDETGCRSCGTLIPFPPLPDELPIVACYGCVRSGRAALAKQTTLGPVHWDDAASLDEQARHDDFRDPGTETWRRNRVESASLHELLRTPTYATRQGERWQFCCRTPMRYRGTWDRDQLDAHAADGDGEAFFREIILEPVPGLWAHVAAEEIGVYAFDCLECGRFVAHWDVL